MKVALKIEIRLWLMVQVDMLKSDEGGLSRDMNKAVHVVKQMAKVLLVVQVFAAKMIDHLLKRVLLLDMRMVNCCLVDDEVTLSHVYRYFGHGPCLGLP